MKPRTYSRVIARLDPLEPRQLMAATTPLRIAAGSAGYLTDSIARTFAPAAGRFVGGRDETSPTTDLANTADDALFATRRIATHFTLAAPVATGHYALFLEFAEPTATAAGQRVFDVSAEGSLMADDVDAFARAGSDAFAIERDLTISDGTLNLSFDASAGEAFVNAIVLVPSDVPPEAQPYDPTRSTTDENNLFLSANRLRLIGQGVLAYENQNKGKLPPTLVELVSDVGVPAEILTNPRSATRPPRGKLSRIEQVAYARTLNDYRYLGAGLTSATARADKIVAYENPDRAAGDLNLLYGDGHVARLARADATALLGLTNAAPTGAAPTVSYGDADVAVLQSQVNLRAIAAGAADYARDHAGRYPADIGALAGYVRWSAFSNPRLGSAAAPAPPASATLDEAIAWINAHSDYAIRPLARNTMPPDDVLLYEKPDAAIAGGLNLLMGDHSVMFRETPWAHASIAANSPPLVVGTSFDADTSTVRVRFDEDVSVGLAAGDVALKNVTTGPTTASSAIQSTFDFAALTAVFSFPGLPGGALPDGDFTATLAAGSLSDAAGNLLASSMSFNFFSLTGDLDHDRDVDFADLVRLAQHYGKTGQSYAQGNIDRDDAGRVDFADLAILARHYNTSLPALTTRKPDALRQPAIVGLV